MADLLALLQTDSALKAALGAVLFPAPHVVTAAGSTQTIGFDAAARETTWDVTMAANTAFTIDTTNMAAGSTLTLILRQDSAAGRTPSLPPKAAWPNSSAPTPNSVAGKIDVMQFYSPDGTTILGSLVTTAAQTPTVPAAPTVSVTSSSAQNVLAITDGAANGSAITSHKIYRSTTPGAETLLGTLASGQTYTDTGLTNGTAYYYRVSAVNGVGEGSQSVEVSGTPTASTHYMAANNSNVASTPTASSNVTSDGYIDLQISLALDSIGGDQNIAGIWDGSSSGSRYLLYQGGGVPNFAFFNGSGTAKYIASNASLSSAGYGNGQKFWLRAVANTSQGALNGFPAGSVTFLTAPDNNGTPGTWTQLSQVGSGQYGPFATGGSQIRLGYGVGGKLYKARAFSSAGGALYNPDFTAQATGTTSFTDTAATPNTWTVSSGAIQ